MTVEFVIYKTIKIYKIIKERTKSVIVTKENDESDPYRVLTGNIEVDCT